MFGHGVRALEHLEKQKSKQHCWLLRPPFRNQDFSAIFKESSWINFAAALLALLATHARASYGLVARLVFSLA